MGVVSYITATQCINDKILGKSTLLDLSIKCNSMELFMHIIDNYNDILNINCDSLDLVCLNNRKEMLSILVANGGDVNCETKYGSLLIGVCSVNYVSLEIVEFLLQNGANVNKSIIGNTPLYRAILYRNTGALELLIKYGANLLELNLSIVPNGKNKEFIIQKIKELHPNNTFEEFAQFSQFPQFYNNKECPLCRKTNLFHKIYANVEINCCICLENSSINYSGTCGHIVCGKCCTLLGGEPCVRRAGRSPNTP